MTRRRPQGGAKRWQDPARCPPHRVTSRGIRSRPPGATLPAPSTNPEDLLPTPQADSAAGDARAAKEDSTAATAGSEGAVVGVIGSGASRTESTWDGSAGNDATPVAPASPRGLSL